MLAIVLRLMISFWKFCKNCTLKAAQKKPLKTLETFVVGCIKKKERNFSIL